MRPILPLARGASASKPCWMRRRGCAARRCSGPCAAVRRRVAEAGKRRANRTGDGVNWDAITGDQRVALLKAGASGARQAKRPPPASNRNDFTVWREQRRPRPTGTAASCAAMRSAPLPPAGRRHGPAYLGPADAERRAARRAVLDGQQLREIAARSFIVAGMARGPMTT